MLVFLSANGITYAKAVDDPWFSAHVYNSTLRTAEVYLADQPVSVLSCAQQYQWCDAAKQQNSGDGCVPLSGYVTSGTRFMQLGSSESQQRAFDWYSQALAPITSATIIATLGSSSLTAKLSLTSGNSGSLPKNQWQIEVDNWFATRLAYLQKSPINAAYGPTDDRLWNIMQRPKDEESQKICRNQVS